MTPEQEHEEHVREMRKGGAPADGCPLCQADIQTVDSIFERLKEGEHNEGNDQ